MVKSKSKFDRFLDWGFGGDVDKGMEQIAFGAQMFGAASKFIGAKYQGKSQQSALRYQSQLAEINQAGANLQGDSIRMAGERAIGAVTRKAGEIKGLQRARLGASGIGMESKSALDVMNRSDFMKELDAIEILKNAVSQEGQARMGATNFAMASNIFSSTANQVNPTRSAAGSLIGDAGGVASKWFYLNKARSGAFGGNTTITG